MIALLSLVLLQAAPSALDALPRGAVHSDMARRGGVPQTGAAHLSVSACIEVCARTANCQAWTFIPTQTRACRLHEIVSPAQPYPGAMTGLAPALARQIEAAAERAPTPREQSELGGS